MAVLALKNWLHAAPLRLRAGGVGHKYVLIVLDRALPRFRHECLARSAPVRPGRAVEVVACGGLTGTTVAIALPVVAPVLWGSFLTLHQLVATLLQIRDDT